jgi:hypothetical protein
MAASYATSDTTRRTGTWSRSGYASTGTQVASAVYTRAGYDTAHVVAIIERPRPTSGLLHPMWWTEG